MDAKWNHTPPGPLYGKRIVRAWIGKLEQVDEYKKEYNDKPYYYIELETGEIFRFVAYYGGWTGKSEGEYQRLISLETSPNNKETLPPLSARFVSYTGKSVELLPDAKNTNKGIEE